MHIEQTSLVKFRLRHHCQPYTLIEPFEEVFSVLFVGHQLLDEFLALTLQLVEQVDTLKQLHPRLLTEVVIYGFTKRPDSPHQRPTSKKVRNAGSTSHQ